MGEVKPRNLWFGDSQQQSGPSVLQTEYQSKEALEDVLGSAWEWQVQQQQQAAHPKQACQMRNEHEGVLVAPKAGSQ